MGTEPMKDSLDLDKSSGGTYLTLSQGAVVQLQFPQIKAHFACFSLAKFLVPLHKYHMKEQPIISCNRAVESFSMNEAVQDHAHINIFKAFPLALSKRKKKKDSISKLQFKADQCKEGKIATVEKTPSGMWPLGKEEGEILPLPVKLISQYQKGHCILAESCWLSISAVYCAVIVPDSNVQSTNWRDMPWGVQSNLRFPGGVPNLSLPRH